MEVLIDLLGETLPPDQQLACYDWKDLPLQVTSPMSSYSEDRSRVLLFVFFFCIDLEPNAV